MAWTDTDKQNAIDTYTAGNPTPENSTELIKQIAEDMEQSANGVRMVLVQAGVYIKKDATATATKTKTGSATTGDKAPRVSKESQIADLRALIEAKGAEVDDDVLSKLTGKAAAYFAKVLA
jgi:ABC-type glycerol-3-phosphate transport system substrate-binding protein